MAIICTAMTPMDAWRRNRARWPGTSFSPWNDEHQMVGSASRQGEWTYHYDALGRRIAKRRLVGITPAAAVWFVWDGMRMAQEEEGQQCVTTVYADGSGYVPLARIEHGRWEKTVTAEQVDYFHTDVNGLPEELTGADGRILWRARYRTWGGLAEEDWDRGREWSGGRHRPAQNLRFQGQYHDAGTGLQYNTFRYYDPDAGRFTSQDPIGLAGGLNLYQYAPEPLSWIDPWGLSCGFDSRASRWRDSATGRFSAPPSVATPYGRAVQGGGVDALMARTQVESGARLYRIGTMGKSQAAEAQFWALESPDSPGYAARYGIPPENVAKADFIETGILKPGSDFVTRVAPPVGKNPGGGIEVVTPENGVTLNYFGTR
ncbi:MAG: hypothetical protein F8N37_19340 [Telmatospirillum sp.]|nr:hypothetical protein [Telmatospirillum sp.]